VAIVLRAGEAQPDDATLIIHGGMGDVGVVRAAAVQNYPEYRAIRDDGFGYFTVSVFATIREIDMEAIVERLVHGSYGVAPAEVVSSAFGLIPTSDDDPELPEDIRWLQECHFDICLPDLTDPRLIDLDPLDDQELLAACQEHVTPHLAALLALFTRHRKA
jgi:hypothetical protein